MTFELKLDALSEMILDGKLYVNSMLLKRHSAVVNAEQSFVGNAIMNFVRSQIAVNMYLCPPELDGDIGPTKSIYV